MSVFFEGQSSGDHECFCWDVTLEEYVRITGHQPDEYENSTFGPKGYYRLYPDDVLRAAGVERDKKYLITVTVEEVGPAVKREEEERNEDDYCPECGAELPEDATQPVCEWCGWYQK